MTTLDQYTITGLVQTSGMASAAVPGTQVTGAAGLVQTSGYVDASAPAPVAAFDDFAVFGLNDPDPAMVYVGANNGGSTTGAYGQPWARNFMLVTPPTDYPVSNGLAWSRAAFASLAWKFTGLDPNNWQYLEDVQFEELPLGSVAPTPYTSPRRIETKVKPDRLNLATNPSFEAGVTDWSPVASTVTRDTAVHHGSGSASGKVAAIGGAYGVSLAISNLIVGRRYIASAWVQGAATLTASITGRASVRSTSYAAPSAVEGQWHRVSVVWDAGSVTDTLLLLATVSGTFWIDEVLVEEGETLRDYFDGSFGDDYLWESNGTIGASRSYYYSQRVEKSYLIQQLLDENTPVGITAADPLFAVPTNN